LQYDIAKGQSGLVVCLETCLPRVLKHPVGWNKDISKLSASALMSY
jgi:hypothetical protein